MINMHVRPRNEKDFPSGGSFYVPVRVCSSTYEKKFTSGGGNLLCMGTTRPHVSYIMY